MITRLYPISAERTDAIRAELIACGVKSARLRRHTTGSMRGAVRIVIKSHEDRDAARDAFVLMNLCTTSGTSFANPDCRHAWNGPVEINVWSINP